MKTISFVIPVYNEEKRLAKTFAALDSAVLPRGFKLAEIIFVDDGSTDKTYNMLQEFVLRSTNNVLGGNTKHIIPNTLYKLISYKPNRGKGYAVRCGMLESSADYTLFFDADMSTPLSELEKFVQYMKKNVDVIVGTRKNGHSTVIQHQPWLREKLGRGFTLLTQVALNTWITDFTCGFKVFSKRSKDIIFPMTQINRWGYDAEIIFLAAHNKLSIVEKSVTWTDDPRTKVKLSKAIPETLKELAQIRWTHSIKPVFKVQSFKTTKVQNVHSKAV